MNKGDEISKEVREEFDLPSELGENTIDYQSVRKGDCNIKIKTPIWSGQDILSVNINQDMAGEITDSYLNKVRVWPKGFLNTVKKARFLLKKMVKTALFDHSMTAAVLVNTVIMAMDRYGVSA